MTITVRGTVTDRRDRRLNAQVNTGLRATCCGVMGKSRAQGDTASRESDPGSQGERTRPPKASGERESRGRGRLARTLCGDSPRRSGASSQTRVPAETPRVSEGNVPARQPPACRGGVQAGGGPRTPHGARGRDRPWLTAARRRPPPHGNHRLAAAGSAGSKRCALCAGNTVGKEGIWRGFMAASIWAVGWAVGSCWLPAPLSG